MLRSLDRGLGLAPFGQRHAQLQVRVKPTIVLEPLPLLIPQARAGLAAPQQQLRGFAEQAVAVALKEPDWDAFYALVSSDEGKREVGSLRSAFNETKKQLEKMGTVRKPLRSVLASLGIQRRIPERTPAAHVSPLQPFLREVVLQPCIRG